MVIKRAWVDWQDDRMRVSVSGAADLLGVSWYAARELMATGRLPARRCGRKSQPYYRTSLRHIRAFLDGKSIDAGEI